MVPGHGRTLRGATPTARACTAWRPTTPSNAAADCTRSSRRTAIARSVEERTARRVQRTRSAAECAGCAPSTTSTRMRGARPATDWCRSSARADQAGNAALLPPRYLPVRVPRAPTRSYSTLLRYLISYRHTRQWQRRRRRRRPCQLRCEVRQTAVRRARAASTRSASSTALSARKSTQGAKAMSVPFDKCQLKLLARDVRLWWPCCSVGI
jgi:hypothetical protein